MPKDDATAARSGSARRTWFRNEVLPHRRQLHTYVRRIMRREEDAEDIVHETLVKVMTLEDWRHVDKPAGFLRRVARNLMLDQVRRRNIVSIQLMSSIEDLHVRDETENPEATWIGREDLLALAEVVAELPLKYQQVFTLRRVYGLSPPEIAKNLGLAQTTVEKYLVRALRYCSDGLARRDIRRSDQRPYGSG